MKIGFFDSGVGGLTILKAVQQHMPEYEYLFYGDTAHLPYGGKSEEEIHALTYHGIRSLFEAGALIVIVACNTASSASVRKHQDGMLQREYPGRKLLGVIVPTVEVLTETATHTNVLLIGTERTVHSKKYDIELAKLTVHQTPFTFRAHATPTLVPKIESGDISGAFEEVYELIINTYPNIDALVLGCTHYTLMTKRLRHSLRATIISQDEIIPEKLRLYLEHHPEIASRLTKKGSVHVTLSSESPTYRTFLESLDLPF